MVICELSSSKTFRLTRVFAYHQNKDIQWFFMVYWSQYNFLYGYPYNVHYGYPYSRRSNISFISLLLYIWSVVDKQYSDSINPFYFLCIFDCRFIQVEHFYVLAFLNFYSLFCFHFKKIFLLHFHPTIVKLREI